MGLLYTFGIALFAAIGTFLFGFDTGIATTSKSHLVPSAIIELWLIRADKQQSHIKAG
jgi:hypothetical protein